MKRLTSIFLVLAMLLTLAPMNIFAAENDKTAFSDMKITDYYAKAATALEELEIISGYPDGTYGAEKSITRAEMATIVCRIIDKEADAEKAKGETIFDDVASDHWASGYINIAVNEGIINGDGNGKFRPEDEVKYEEAIKMIVCALGYADNIETDPADWSKAYLDIANDKGITSDLKGKKGEPATRGDIAVMSYNGLATESENSKIPATPVASVKAGEYKGTQKVKLSTVTKDSDIYYTTDGTTPTVKSTKYTKEISISKTSTLKAIAVKNGVVSKDVLSVDYTIKKISSGGGGGGGSSRPSTTTYTVSFDLNYDGKKDTQSVTKGNSAIKPEIDNREGYILGGWYKDQEFFEPFDFENDKITENITLYAFWNPIDNENISYEKEDEIVEDENGQKYIDNELIITGKEDTLYSEMQLYLNSFNGKIVGYIPVSNDYQVVFSNLTDLNELINQLQNSSLIEDVFLNYVDEYNLDISYSNDDWDGAAWNEEKPAGKNWGFEAIKAMSAWESVETNNRIKVGLIDSDFETEHEDLKSRFMLGDVYDSWGSSSLSNKIKEDGGFKHGTHVAGTMAATSGNGKGIAGVCPNTELYGFAMWGKSSIKYQSDMHWRYALSKLITSGVKVINISMSTNDVVSCSKGENKEAMERHLKSAERYITFLQSFLNNNFDFLLVIAAGNDRDKYELADTKWSIPFNAIENESVKSHIIVVGAAKNDNGKYSWANFSNGGNRVDVIAPGVDIYSCVPGGYEGGWNGTSMAAPHVTGAAAFLWSMNPNLKGENIKNILLTTATTDVEGTDKKMINLYSASKLVSRTNEKFSDNSNSFVIGMVKAASSEGRVTGATVTLYDDNDNKIDECITEDGMYVFCVSTGNYRIDARKENYIDSDKVNFSISSGETKYLNDIYIDSPQGLKGKVVDAETNQNLADVVLSFYKGNELISSAGTKYNGEFTAQLPAGTYKIELNKYGYKSKTVDNVVINRGTWTQWNSPQTMNKIDSGISGMIHDSATENLLANVKITVYDSNEKAITRGYTDIMGCFEIPCEPGIYSLICEKEMYYNTTVVNIVVENGVYDVGNVRMNEKVEFAGGDGTEEKPYKVSTPQQLNAIRNNPKANYIQTNDIDLSMYSEWVPISDFSGNYDGNNYKIKNMTITNSLLTNIGLFNGGNQIKNVKLINANINISINDDSKGYYSVKTIYAGTISSNCSSMDNCYADGTLAISHINQGYVGGLTGYGKINNSINHVNISISCDDYYDHYFSDSLHVGGLIGHTSSVNAVTHNNINYGDINADAQDFLYCGGISGEYGNIENCLNYGNIAGSVYKSNGYSSFAANCNVGGIVGATSADKTQNSANLGNVCAKAKVSGSVCAGGIAGFCGYYSSGNIINCYNDNQSVQSIRYTDNGYEYSGSAGRIAGSSRVIQNCYSSNTTVVNGAIPTENCASNSTNGATTDNGFINTKIEEILNIITN